MRAEYDFSKLRKHRNSYAKALKKQVTIRIGTDVIRYFKSMADAMGVPYQSLINLYLRDCVETHRKLTWAG